MRDVTFEADTSLFRGRNPYYAPAELMLISYAIEDESFTLQGKSLLIALQDGSLLIMSFEADIYLVHSKSDPCLLYPARQMLISCIPQSRCLFLIHIPRSAGHTSKGEDPVSSTCVYIFCDVDLSYCFILQLTLEGADPFLEVPMSCGRS